MTELQQDVIKLLRSALTGEKQSLSAAPAWQDIYDAFEKHKILPLLYYGAQNSEITLPQEICTRTEKSTLQFLAATLGQLDAAERIMQTFAQNGIDYMPLKGIRLNQLYAQPEMRSMGDLDILIRQEQYAEIRPLMHALGFTETEESDHEFIWSKPPLLCVELHKRLVPSYNADFYGYFGDGWQLPLIEDGNHGYSMTAEQEFLYLFVHLTKHYRDGGIGFRHFLDLQVYADKHPEINRAHLEAEAEKLKLLSFYQNVCLTLDVWFKDGKATEITDLITARVFVSGVYGTTAEKNAAMAVRSKNSAHSLLKAKLVRLIPAVFLPYGQMAEKYPVLKKCPILLPFMWVVRWINALFNRRSTITSLCSLLHSMNKKTVDTYSAELEKVGLNSDFRL